MGVGGLHPDHLGTSTALTDFNGSAYQFFLNLPFGETMAEQKGFQYYNSPYKFNGKELDEETGLYYYGARYYDPRASIWLSVDPLAEKFPNVNPYAYCLDNPINAIDPDGRDVIVLGNSSGAKRAGHQAVLIGDNKRGWIYISKDGAAKSGGAHGKSRYTAKYFKSVDEFKNSAHNFEVIDGTNHSNVGGGENRNMVFKLDENGNKIQRYDQATYIATNGVKENEAVIAGWHKAEQDYTLTTSDCSDIPTTVLNILQDRNGKTLKNGEADGILNERPNSKQEKIESRNDGVDYDSKVKPTTTKLQKGEKGEKSD